MTDRVWLAGTSSQELARVMSSNYVDRLGATQGMQVAGSYLTNDVDTLASVAVRGGFVGSEEIGPFRVNCKMLGEASGEGATGWNWVSLGFSSGYEAAGDEWTALGYEAGSSVRGSCWTAIGNGSGVGASGDFWTSCGRVVGTGAIWTNSAAFGCWAAHNARGRNRLFVDVYGSSPGVSHDPTNDMIFGDNGQLLLGRCGALTNALPNELRGRWTGDASGFTGITAAQVGALAANAVPAAGCTDLGATNGPVITGVTVSYLAAPTAAYTLSVDAGAPRYCYAVEILSTNSCTLGAGLTLRGAWTVTGTNVVAIVPSTGTLWRVYGRGL